MYFKRGSGKYPKNSPDRRLFHWWLIPFGLHSATGTFQRAASSDWILNRRSVVRYLIPWAPSERMKNLPG